MTDKTSRREQKKFDTRAKMVRVGLRLFATQGYDTTTMAQIARAAGTSRRTVFRYFAKKEDIVFYDHEYVRALWKAALAERHKGDTLVDRYRRAARAVLRFLNVDNPAVEPRIGHMRWAEPALLPRTLAFNAELEQLVAAVAAEEYGCAPDDPHAQFAAAALASAFRKMGQMWIGGGGVDRGGELLDVAFAMLRPGLDHPAEA